MNLDRWQRFQTSGSFVIIVVIWRFPAASILSVPAESVSRHENSMLAAADRRDVPFMGREVGGRQQNNGLRIIDTTVNSGD
jgi:hypothetical protein